jgi:hypothetical protein
MERVLMDRMVDALQGIVICLNDQNHLLREVRDSVRSIAESSEFNTQVVGELEIMRERIVSKLDSISDNISVI